MKLSSLLAPLACGAITVVAQSWVAPPSNVDVVLSERFPGANISYKEVNGLCETTDGVRSFSGYVHLPKDFLPDSASWSDGLSVNFHFWYFEARKDPENAPTAIYLGGGPGYSSHDGSSVFPCYVNPDSNSTRLNEHSWNNRVNMLYIDQPVGTGFSYTNLANGTLDLVTREFVPATGDDDLPNPANLTLLPATIQPSGISNAPNTTKSAARALWSFSQVWFNEFPEIITENKNISIWAVSYGGIYAPVFATHFLDQNELIENDEHELANATVLSIGTIGLINAMVDISSMGPSNPVWANNNTYGLQTLPEEVAAEALANITAPDVGCLALVDVCRAAVEEGDPEGYGNNPEVNEACVGALQVCGAAILTSFQLASPNWHFDITLNKPAVLPTDHEMALFNQRWVQEELGIPLNFTRGNSDIEQAFLAGTGDMMRYGLEHLGRLLDSGVNVAMVYGDRDYRCNWYSGENASLHIPFEYASEFAAAGYEPITITDSSSEGGLVREHGSGLSFSRVFQAGHSAGGYQPETVSAIFERAMFRRNVASGDVDLLLGSDAEDNDEVEAYVTVGPANVRNVTNELPEALVNICYVLDPATTCTEEQIVALRDGSAEVENWIVVTPEGSKGTRLGEEEEADDDADGSSDDQDGSTSAPEDESAGIKVGVSHVAAMVFMLVSGIMTVL